METKQPVKALVLSGGGAKGAVHLGALIELEQMNLRWDLIVGTSIGAMVAAGYALTLRTETMRRYAEGMNQTVPVNIKNPKRIPPLLACWFTNTFQSLFPRPLFFKVVERVFGDRTFEDTKIPLLVTACNIDKRCIEVFREGPLITSLLASMAIPGVFPPVRIGANAYCDGGVLENLPIRTAVTAGAGRILAFHIVAKSGSEKPPFTSGSTGLLLRTDAIREQWQDRLTDRANAKVIAFDTTNYGVMDFRHTSALLEIGKETVRRRRQEILEWLL